MSGRIQALFALPPHNTEAPLGDVSALFFNASEHLTLSSHQSPPFEQRPFKIVPAGQKYFAYFGRSLHLLPSQVCKSH